MHKTEQHRCGLPSNLSRWR